MAHGVGHIRAQRVGLGQIFAVELLPCQLRQRSAGVQLRLQLRAGAAGGLAGHQRLAAAGGIAGVRRDPCVAALIHHVIALQAGAGHHRLYQHGAQSLPDAAGAGVDVHLSVVLHDELAAPPVGDAHAHAGVLHGAGDTHRVACRHRRVIGGLDGLQRLHKAGGLVHDLAVGQHAAGLYGVAVPDLPRADAHQIGHLVQQRLRAEAGLCHAEAPERAGRRVVGVVGMSLDLKILIGVRPCRVGAGPLQHRSAQRRERAGVGHHAGLHALNDAVFVTAHGELHVKAVALGVDEDGLLPAELHLHRHPRHIGQQCRVMLHGHVLLAAEATAHQHVLHLTVLIVHAQHSRALVHGGVGALVRGQQPHAAVVQRQCHAALRLQERMLRPRRVELLRQHIFRSGNGPRRVPAGDVLVGLHVALLFLEHQRCTGRRRLGGIMHRRQHLVLHLYQLLGGLQRLLIPGAHQRHRVAQIVGQLADADEGGLILLQMAHVDLAGNVLLGQHAHHTLQRLRLGGVDAQDSGAGILAAHRAAVAHAVHIHIVGVLAIAQHLLLHVQPVDAAAHLPVVGSGRGQLPLPENFRRQQDAVNDLHIAGAPADVVADGEGRLLPGGVGVHVQQPLGGDDHAGDAEAALHRARLAEGEGIHLLLPVAEALHRHDGLALQLVRLGNARLGGLAVDKHMAGAAGALAASVFHRGQVQRVPQIADELLILLDDNGLSVHGESGHIVLLPAAGRPAYPKVPEIFSVIIQYFWLSCKSYS